MAGAGGILDAFKGTFPEVFAAQGDDGADAAAPVELADAEPTAPGNVYDEKIARITEKVSFIVVDTGAWAKPRKLSQWRWRCYSFWMQHTCYVP